jgi:hypothetical protein
MGRPGARGAMRQFADQMPGPLEREHPMMAMVTRGPRTAARPAPPLLDRQFDACAPRVFRPAGRHAAPRLGSEVWGNQHTIFRPFCVLAFCRTIAKKCQEGRFSVLKNLGILLANPMLSP